MDAEKIERLILLVNDYNELYDMSNKNYSNQNRRDNIWSEIGKKLNENGDICKKKWKTLRDAFQKAAKSMQTKSGQAATISRKWKYWDAMSFLLPHIKGRETQTNVCSDETGENFEDGDEIDSESHFEQTEETEEQTFENNYHENPTSPSVSLPTTQQSCSSSAVNVSRPVSRVASAKSDAVPNKKNKSAPRTAESMPEILKEYIQEKKRSRLKKQTLAIATQSTDSKDSALLEFFTSMAKTTSTFPPLWQAKVKNKIFEIVNFHELALLEASSASPAPPLVTESLTQPQTQSTVHTQQMHILPMQNQSPVQNQSTTNSLLCYNNESLLHSLQPPSAAYYSSFAAQLSAIEKSSGQNIMRPTTDAGLDTAATDLSNRM
ncbi:unnamed protein product [Phaedon cochleariae]|uniref:MADF domain-containing protein n=1 Tax=Phaedon cochleariae TaxID=80249 RepID=A0A9N9X4B3_PHACE|nr:unnamed protein product [Phaedon cochleariae]